MPRIDNLIITTDFDTLRSDDKGQLVVTFPASTAITAAGNLSFSSDIRLGKAESLLNVSVNSAKDGTDYIPTSTWLQFQRTGSLGLYIVYVNCSHVGGNIIRLTAMVVNPYGSTMTTASGIETFTALIKSYNQPKFS